MGNVPVWRRAVAVPAVILTGAALCIVTALLPAHSGPPSNRIGEYRVVLNWIRVLSFADNAFIFSEPNPDLFIRTFSQAETHVGQIAAFGEFADTRVGTQTNIGRLIYWHLDCAPSEKLRLTVDVGDRDNGAFAAILAAALKAGGGIVAQQQPTAAPVVNAAVQELIGAIDAELKADDQFPQFSSGDGFTILDNAGTLVRQSGIGGVGMTGQYEFSATHEYVERRTRCTDRSIFELQKLIVDNDAEVRAIKERVVKMALESGKKATGRAVLEGLSDPFDQLRYAVGEAEVGMFSIVNVVRFRKVRVELVNDADEFTRFYIIGAAAQAFTGTDTQEIDVVDSHSKTEAEKAAVLSFLDVPAEDVGSGKFISGLLAKVAVLDI
jgi:hypothetical protein